MIYIIILLPLFMSYIGRLNRNNKERKRNTKLDYLKFEVEREKAIAPMLQEIEDNKWKLEMKKQAHKKFQCWNNTSIYLPEMIYSFYSLYDEKTAKYDTEEKRKSFINNEFEKIREEYRSNVILKLLGETITKEQYDRRFDNYRQFTRIELEHAEKLHPEWTKITQTK